MFPFKPRDQESMTDRVKDAEKRKQAIELLKASREQEEKGLESLRAIAAALAADEAPP